MTFLPHLPTHCAQESALWNTTYQAPQYGRKRCPDLMVTGPTLRGAAAGGGRPGSAAPYAAHVADDATSYISGTTYYR